MKVSKIDNNGTVTEGPVASLVFELTDAEWYGFSAEGREERQAALLADMRQQAYEAPADGFSVFVTPDALFSCSPITGRHRAHGERLIAPAGKVQVTCTIQLDKVLYDKAPEGFRKHMIERAAGTVATEIRTLNTYRTEAVYVVYVGDEVVDTGTFDYA
jgi:hypothetical protein